MLESDCREEVEAQDRSGYILRRWVGREISETIINREHVK